MTGFREGQHNDAKDELSHLTKYIQTTLQTVSTVQSETMTNPLGLGSKERELVRRKNAAKTKWRRSGRPEDKNSYHQLLNNVQDMLKSRASRSWEGTLQDCEERCSLWPIVKRLRVRAAPNAPLEDPHGILHLENAEKANIAAEFLTNQFTNKQPGTALSGDPIIPNAQPSEPIVFSLDEVKLAIKAMNTRKAPGLDNLPPRAIKLVPERAIISLTNIFKDINKGEAWKTARVSSISKKDKNPTKIGNTRPISVTPILSRLYEKLLIPTLERYIEKTQQCMLLNSDL